MYPSERASEAFQQGYRDCRDNRPKLFEHDGTFRGGDYAEGWAACWNELYWDAWRENERRNFAAEQAAAEQAERDFEDECAGQEAAEYDCEDWGQENERINDRLARKD